MYGEDEPKAFKINQLEVSITKIKSAFRTDLFKVSFLNGIATFIRMLTGVVSVKVIAKIIGPPGIALLGQLNNFSTIMLSISNGGIVAGVTKYVSKNSNDESGYMPFLRTGFMITLVLSIISSLCLILFADHFSMIILKSQDYRSVFYIFGSTLTLYAMNSWLLAVINGFKLYRIYVITNIAGSIIGLILSLLLSYKYGTWGALVSSITFQSLVFLVTISMVLKFKWLNLKELLKVPDRSTTIKLSHYSLMAITSAVVMPTAQLIVRSHIKTHSSLMESGIWEGVNKVSNMYLMVIITSLSIYFLPRIAELDEGKDVKSEILKVYKLIIPFMVLGTILIYILRKTLIHVLFTPEFESMESLFPYQLLGDIFKMMGWVLGYVMLAKSMTKTYIFMELLSGIFFTGFSILFINTYGTIGATTGYMLSNFLYLVLVAFKLRFILLKA